MFRRLLITLSVTSIVIASGCALFGGGGDLQRAKGYSVKGPPGWQTFDHAEADRAYKLSTGSLVTFTSSCNRNSDAPLETLTRHLLMGARNISVLEQKKESVDGATGLKSTVKATMEGKPFNLILFVLTKNDCIFDFSLVTPRGVTSAEDKEFMAFVHSFQYGKN